MNALEQITREGTNRAMKSLHDEYGFDFCKPYYVSKIWGSYTVNKIRKILAEKEIELTIGYNSYTAVIITRLADCPATISNDWHVVRIFDNTFDVVKGISGYDWFFTKAEFNDFRKHNCETVILAQKNEYLTPKTKKESSDMERVISKNQIKRLEFGRLIFFQNEWREYDKSGYNVKDARYSLKIRLRDYKENKAKRIANAIDYSKRLEALEKLTSEKKSILAKAFEGCSSFEDYDKFCYALVWGGFREAMRILEAYRNRYNEKSFSSVDDERNRYETIVNCLTKIPY